MTNDQTSAQSSAEGPAMPDSLRRIFLKSPIIFSSTSWTVLCVGYALWQVPEAPLTSPELLREQLQLRIRGIPVPVTSPRYQQFKEYYSREHEFQLQEYKVAYALWQRSAATFNWRAFVQGLGVGVLILSAALAVLEYHHGLISYWMEAAEEMWCDAQQKRVKRLQLADSQKMERLLQEMGEGSEDAGKGVAKRRKPVDSDTRRVKAPVTVIQEAVPLPTPPALPTASSPVPAAKEETPKPMRSEQGSDGARAVNTSAAEIPAAEQTTENPTLLQAPGAPSSFTGSAALIRERLRCKVIERHRQQSEQASALASQELAAPPPESAGAPAKKEKKTKNKKAQAKKEEPSKAKEEGKTSAPPPACLSANDAEASCPDAMPVEPCAKATEEAPKEDAPSPKQEAAQVEEALEQEETTVACNSVTNTEPSATVPTKSKSAKGKKETPKPSGTCKADPEVEAALQRLARQPLLAPKLRGPELLREAQELLSRLEAEDLLRQLETEEERARQVAGKKKAKKNKAAARAKASAKKGQKSDASVEQGVAAVNPQEGETEEKEESLQEAVQEAASEIKIDTEIAEEKESGQSSVEDSTKLNSPDGQDSQSSSAVSDEEGCPEKKDLSGQPTIPHASHVEPEKESPISRRASWADVEDTDDDSQPDTNAPSLWKTAWAQEPAIPGPSQAEPDKESPISRRASWADAEDEVTKPEPAPRAQRKTSFTEVPTPPTPPPPVRSRAAKATPKPRAKKAPVRAAGTAAPLGPFQAPAPRRRPWNYAEAATGHTLDSSISREAVELMTAMGIVGSRDELVAFIQANASEQWRREHRASDLNASSFKDLSRMAADLLQRTEDVGHAPEGEATSAKSSDTTEFNGALAGAQILEWMRGGKTNQGPMTTLEEHESGARGKNKSCTVNEEVKLKSDDTQEETSQLRAEAPEFVPAPILPEQSQEVSQPVLMLPEHLPPGCHLVMVPVQLAPMPMFNKEGMASGPSVALPSNGMAMMAMPAGVQPVEFAASWQPCSPDHEAFEAVSPTCTEAQEDVHDNDDGIPT